MFLKKKKRGEAASRMFACICQSVFPVTEQRLQTDGDESTQATRSSTACSELCREKMSRSINSPDKSQEYQYCITLHKILLFAVMDNTYLLIQISYRESLFTI